MIVDWVISNRIFSEECSANLVLIRSCFASASSVMFCSAAPLLLCRRFSFASDNMCAWNISSSIPNLRCSSAIRTKKSSRQRCSSFRGVGDLISHSASKACCISVDVHAYPTASGASWRGPHVIPYGTQVIFWKTRKIEDLHSSVI